MILFQKSLKNFLTSVKKFLRCFFFQRSTVRFFVWTIFFFFFARFFLINQKELKIYFSNFDIFSYIIKKKTVNEHIYFLLFDNFDSITIKLQICFVEIRQKIYQNFYSNQLSIYFIFESVYKMNVEICIFFMKKTFELT